MNIKVSIPVEVGGYTGQRDQWQSSLRDYNVVSEDDGRVLLENVSPTGHAQKIWFDLEELQEAVEFVNRKEG